MSKEKSEVAVIGGGVIGLLTACMLAERGKQVAIFDQSKLAGESSWAGGGILTPLYPWRYSDSVNQLAFRSQKIYPKLVKSLIEQTGVDPQYTECGMLINKAEIDSSGVRWIDKHQICIEADRKPCQFGRLAEDLEFVFFPQIAQVRNPRLVQSLVVRVAQLNIEVRAHCRVRRLINRNSHFDLETEHGIHRADQVVVSAGAWSNQLLKSLNLDLGVKPVRGQMLLYKTEPGFLKSIVLSEGNYIIPRIDGRILVGSTMEDVGFDRQTTDEAKHQLQSFVARTLPDLEKFPIEQHWAGLRPGSPKGIPIICRHPQYQNLFINTGHFRNGVVMAPASVELLVDLMFGSPPKLDPSQFSMEKAI